MKKVAVFINSLSGGGMERAMLNLANVLTEQGIVVDFLVASGKGPLLYEAQEKTNLIDLSEENLKHISIRRWLACNAFSIEPLFILLLFIKRLPKSIKVIPALIDYIKRQSPDVIISSPTTSNLALLWAARYCNFDKKIIVREATTLTKELTRTRTIFNKFVKILVPKWYKHADAVVCVSDGVREDLISNFCVSQSRASTILNVIDIGDIERKCASDEYDSVINEFKPFILSVGRLDETKDYETLIKAYYEIRKDTNCQLVILGEGPERAKLESLVENLCLSGRVHLPGFVVNPYPFIKNCAVFALSSIQEGSPNVLREALVFKKKIISTDCPSGAREILRDGDYGVIVPVGDCVMYSRELLNLVLKKNNSYNVPITEENKCSIGFYKKMIFDA